MAHTVLQAVDAKGLACACCRKLLTAQDDEDGPHQLEEAGLEDVPAIGLPQDLQPAEEGAGA